MRTSLILVAVLGCKDKSEPVRVDPPPRPANATAVLSEAEFKTRSSLRVAPEAGAFAVTDGAGLMKITLPKEPTVDNKLVSESGVSVFSATAVMPGGDVDVQLGAMTSRDGDLPAALLDGVKNTPDLIVAQTGGAVAKNEAGTLAGNPARLYEVTTTDGRRMFGWMIHATAHARMYQINCVGVDTQKTRTACVAIAGSLALK